MRVLNLTNGGQCQFNNDEDIFFAIANAQVYFSAIMHGTFCAETPHNIVIHHA